MKYITPQITSQINTLVNIAKYNYSEEVRLNATHILWEVCGDYIVRVIVKNSIKVDSNHSYHGMSFEGRCRELLGESYELFLKWLGEFDPSQEVPFLAFISKKSEWQMRDEKRKNSRRSKWGAVVTPYSCNDTSEYVVDELYSGSACFANCDENPFTHKKNSFESEIERKDMIKSLRRALSENSKLLELFDAMREVNDENNKCSDAKVAEKLGCTRANVGLLHKKLRIFLGKMGLDDDC